MIKRYRYDFKSGIVADNEGGFVSYADYLALAEQVRLLTEQRDAVVAEDVQFKSAIKALSVTAEECELNGDELRYVVGTDEFEALTNMLDATRATDAILDSLRAEAKAEAIPEGYVLVPQEMYLDADAVECICSHGGDGGHNYGAFTDVVLWIGDVENDDGSKTRGLNVSSADYPEDGSINIYEFARQLRDTNSTGESQ